MDADRNGIDAWTVRLVQQRIRLEAQYAALVRTLGQLQNVQAYLSQQFDAMFTSK
ncbi:hypothetical protein [Leifsonia xyli]|uniref:hypothetical protein n=1 Tax=Leifsonia xyli TaxID=1575 RepID=UPI0002FFE571|nr:hypothetical protein [Leifsonia xyli]